MNDSELRKLLFEARPPAVNEAHADRALERALIALRNAPKTEEKSSWRFGVAIATAACVACVILAFFFNRQGEDSSERILTEMEHIFPGQLQAVILSGSRTDLRLSKFPENELSTDQRVRVIVETGTETAEILTYSGRLVCIPLKSGPLCLTPLLTAEGEVIVVTEDIAFARTGRANSARIRASSIRRS